MSQATRSPEDGPPDHRRAAVRWVLDERPSRAGDPRWALDVDGAQRRSRPRRGASEPASASGADSDDRSQWWS